ncbi:MAG: hypothetical protein CMB80_33065 [Flammeovirgaceae bacterium]|nr:hypothetical protein [Flammeovirgaceae bacterium]MBE62252.1 hypothetical protein [Flammeovirgaceae bacterium]MBR10577.1 hypothetical protein [Rickettsiales bacterium]HCX23386.1 hypothetical protein [Cytophagales bacterium]|tara:strand:+ start:6790 stop:7086 length:297 start_codon:yes stop_codon:yes gene_type:complete
MISSLQNKRAVIIAGAILILLSVPFIAMQLTEDVAWSGFDFLVMGGLLTVVGIGIEIAIRKLKTFNQRFIAVAVVVLFFLLIWIELAVGLFGTPFAGN